ncbi:hypothetical protein J7I94_32320 [Streptomyces sp. ISL-12]|uniref:hypothetical protein n=1 Tax=Streptomyces sp. ISL-12 TaxID=2819177 RepID=UPI001BEA9F3E|nr:hypothetical protein [Streptomyces sp. ISL-12]MBT2415172.1 hypothetical protein [Streptomyces sp. ISL-12]
MLRHEFQPGRLVAGAFLAVAGVVYAGDAGGLWETPWFAVIPVVIGGLCLAGAVGTLAHGVRRRRRPPDHRPPDTAEPHADTRS